jgi:hypothetical protein
MTAGASTTDGEPHTRPASDAPHGDDSDGDSSSNGSVSELDLEGPQDTGAGCRDGVDVHPIPTAIEVLVDVSQSMATQFVDHDVDGGTPDVTRWNMLASALAEHLSILAEDTNVGLQLFPAVDAPAPMAEAACDAAVGPAQGASVDELLGALPPADATFMLGATPMASAFASANWRLQLVEDGRPRFIVVVTDGAPNCDLADVPPAMFEEVDDGARGWAEYAYGMEIPTYVVAVAVPPGPLGGGPEGDPFADHLLVLQSIASSGGTNLLVADDAVALDGALTLIEQATASCRVRVPDELLGQEFYVRVDGFDYGYVPIETCSFIDGFAFVGSAPDTVQLCGQACAAFRTTGTATLIETCASDDVRG